MCHTLLTLWVKCGHQTRHIYPCEQCPNKLDISMCPLGIEDRRTRMRRIHCGCGKQLGPSEDSDSESTIAFSDSSEVEVCLADEEVEEEEEAKTAEREREARVEGVERKAEASFIFEQATRPSDEEERDEERGEEQRGEEQRGEKQRGEEMHVGASGEEEEKE